MDPAFASIVGTFILGCFTVVVAMINGRSTDRKVIASAVDEATKPLIAENTQLKAELAAAREGGVDHEA